MQETGLPSASDFKDYLDAILGFAGVVVTAIGTVIVKHYLDKRKEKAKTGAEIELKLTFDEYAEIHERINDLIATTKAERFLILKAENGASMPDDTTILHALPPSKDVLLTSDVRFKIDGHYREMLVQTERHEMFHMATDNMPENSKLRQMFLSDRVTHANCYFMCKYPSLIDGDKWTILYFMLTTTQTTTFTPHEHTKFGMFADWIRELFAKELGQ
jgi:hypothetical protein